MIGTNLKKICEQEEITLYRVSKETGISQSYLSEIINGKATNPSIDILVKLSEYLKVPLDVLVR